jgi:hypothetical protein
MAAGVAVVLTFVIYALALAPPRYRRHGDNRMRETLAHRNGLFGLNLPEDPVDEPKPRHE